MRSRATWRIRQKDPRNWLGWLARDPLAPARWVAGNGAKVLRLAAFAEMVGGQWLAAALLFIFASAPEGVVSSLDAIWGGRIHLKARRFSPRPLPVSELLTLPSPEPSFPCRIEILNRGTLVGTDIGIVTFLEGWLHYEGHRTSFSLRRSDVSERSGERLNLAEGGTVAFEPHDWIELGDTVEFDLKKRFGANLRSWMRSDAPVGEPILPPLTFHSSGVLRAWSNLVTDLVSCVPMYAFLLWLTSYEWATLLILPFLLSLTRSLRDVRRVRKTLGSMRPLPAVE